MCATIVKCTLSRIVYPGISADQTSRKRRSDTFSGTEEKKEDVDRFIMYLAVRRFRLSLHNERKFLLPHLPPLSSPPQPCLLVFSATSSGQFSPPENIFLPCVTVCCRYLVICRGEEGEKGRWRWRQKEKGREKVKRKREGGG